MAGMTNAVRDALASLARSFKRISVYRHARDQHLAYLEPAAAELRSLLEQKPSVTVVVEPTALIFEGEPVHSEPARETGFCFRLYRDGVRSLTFRRGVGLDELLALAHVAMADPQAEGGREDAVTELWKADLPHISYSAGSGYRMGESAGETLESLGEISARAQETLDRHTGERFVELDQQPSLWSDEQRLKGDSQDYGLLSRRAAMTILRIVELDYAGWDLQALQETFWRLIDQLLERAQAPAIAQALERLRRLEGSHANEFRKAVGAWLADPARLEKAVKLAPGSERPALLFPWLALLPPEAGPAVLAVLPQALDPAARLLIANAAAARVDSCAAQLSDLLRKGAAQEALALLAALATLPAQRRAELAAAAFEHRDAAVRLEAVPLVAADPAVALHTLGAPLNSPLRQLRVAAVQALSGCLGVAEQAAGIIVAAISSPKFSARDKEERTLFYRSLGRLGSGAGYTFLLEQLSRRSKKIFGRRKLIAKQLLAVQGLAEDGSIKAARALEDALLPSRGYPPAVVAACKAAAQHLRAAPRGRSA